MRSSSRYCFELQACRDRRNPSRDSCPRVDPRSCRPGRRYSWRGVPRNAETIPCAAPGRKHSRSDRPLPLRPDECACRTRGISRASRNRFSSVPCFTTLSTCGITSPARSTSTVSPACRPSRSTSSILCSVELAHRDAADLHRLEHRDRREHARAAHAELDLAARRRFLMRGIFVGDRPARRLRREAQFILQRDFVHLHDDAVDLVGQLFAAAYPSFRYIARLRSSEWHSFQSSLALKCSTASVSRTSDSRFFAARARPPECNMRRNQAAATR